MCIRDSNCSLCDGSCYFWFGAFECPRYCNVYCYRGTFDWGDCYASDLENDENKLMQKFAFKMHLKPGCEEEYKKRHDEIWPELLEILKEAGISDYSIHLDRETNVLFGTLMRIESHNMSDLPNKYIMKKWWTHMADIMQTYPNNEPVITELTPVFYMP